MTDTSNPVYTGEVRLKQLVDLTAQIVAAHAGAASVPSGELPGLIDRIFLSLKDLRLEEGAGSPVSASASQAVSTTPPTPAVPVEESVTPDAIVCLEDGKKVKLLHRHIKNRYGMTPPEYRRKWGLPNTYPMVAPAYSESRRDHARKVGFQKRDDVRPTPVAAAAKSSAKPAVAAAAQKKPAVKRAAKATGTAPKTPAKAAPAKAAAAPKAAVKAAAPAKAPTATPKKATKAAAPKAAPAKEAKPKVKAAPKAATKAATSAPAVKAAGKAAAPKASAAKAAAPSAPKAKAPAAPKKPRAPRKPAATTNS